MSALTFLRFVVARYSEDLLSVRAQSLTYTTILSMVPFLAVTFSVLKAFGVHNQVQPLLVQALAPLGADGEQIAVQLVGFVDHLQVGVLGIVGVAGLFYTTISVIGQIEESLNAIWHVRRSRTLTERFRDYLAVVLVGPVLIFSAFALTASAQSHWIVQRLFAVRGLGALLLVMTRLLPLAFLCAAFTFLYEFMPRTNVRWRAAVAGGLTAAVLWQLAGVAFAAFVAGSTKYTAIYSSFAILVIFLFWLYVSWLIVLLGGEVAYFTQYPMLLRAAPGVRTGALTEARVLELVIDVTRRHLAAEPPQSTVVMAKRLGLSLEAVEELVDALVGGGILLRSAEPPGIALARAPSGVSAGDVLAALQGGPNVVDGPIGAVLEQRDQAVRKAMAETTLEALAVAEDASRSDFQPRPVDREAEGGRG